VAAIRVLDVVDAAKPRWLLADETPLLLNLAGKDQFVDPEIPALVDLAGRAG